MAAQELESLWRRQSCFGSETVIVDFSGVIHIDRKSRALLRSMYEKGVKFRGARMSIQDVLDEITAPGTFIDNDVQGT